MSLTTSAPLSHRPPTAHDHPSMGGYDDRSYPAAPYYSRPSDPANAPPPHEASPERLRTSQDHAKGGPPQSPFHTHELPPPQVPAHNYPPQPPITPLSTPAYPPPPPAGGGYYGVAQTATDQHIPSPPPTGNERPASGNYTPDGVPIVPVGISGGKMFRCRGYGECDKVFTRSEHLARHVRKHTGERPFPCHCGKAFSRLDNLRQHAATVHADQAGLNDAMLNSLAPVHAALSHRANRDQRKRGEVVEVPKNAVERPRHNEGYRQRESPGSQGDNAAYAPYGYGEAQWNVPPPQHSRPRTGAGHDYPYPPVEGYPPHTLPPGDEAGSSRRPASAAGYPGYPPPYYDQTPRPPTAPGTSSSVESISQLPYPYRPMSSNGRELPVPAHYAESEAPNSAHGPPHSPYPPGVPQANWSSPPPHSVYPSHEPSQYPPQAEGYTYPPENTTHYGQAPPDSAGSHYNYPPAHGYYPQQGQYGSAGHPQPPHFGPVYSAGAGPPESPFSYNAPQDQPYPYGQYDSRKRRAEDEGDSADRKQPRPSSAIAQPAPQHLGEALAIPRQQEALWLPPTSERRSSLAISALLGSPQQTPRSRPPTAEATQQQAPYGPPAGGYTYPAHQDSSSSSSMPATPAAANGTPRRLREDAKHDMPESMEQKARALLDGQGR